MEKVVLLLPLPFHKTVGLHETIKNLDMSRLNKNAESYFLSLSHFLMAKKAEMHVHSTPLTCS